MRLKTHILIQTLSASLAFTLFLSCMFFAAVGRIRNMVLVNSGDLGDSAADISARALEEQITDRISRIASDTAVILDEKLNKIENHTRMTADITGSIYSNKEAWRPHPLPYVYSGEMPPPEPYIHAAPGVDLSQIRRETDLAGNIGDFLRQITVVDRGITTSTIGGESGYIIVMDAFPWPSVDFDARLRSWYQGAKRRGDLCWSGVYPDLRGRGPVISCAMPFYDRSGGSPVFQGVARSTVMLADFSKLINSAEAGRTGYVFLLDQSGMKLFSSGSIDVRTDGNSGIAGENYLRSEDPRLRSLGLSMTLGASGMTELDMNGLPVYVAYAPVNTLGWSLGVAIPVQEISGPARLIEDQIRNLTSAAKTGMDRHIVLLAGFIGIMLLASLCAITLLSVKFTAMITGPILALNEGVREVSGGNLDREVQIKTGDELEQLAASFNNMTGRLREHIGEIARVTAERERIATELDVATRIQASMLPDDFPPFPDRKNEFALYAVVYPAKEVGGDFYDFFFIDNDHFAVVIADVSGKGIPAALFMAITQTLVKNHLQAGDAPELALQNINRQLCDHNLAGMFVTLWLGVLEISTGRLNFVNAGHNPPLLKSGESDFHFLASPADLVLAGMEDTVYHSRQALLEDGDTLFLYTDGVTETADLGEAFYGKKRLKEFLDSHHALPLENILFGLNGDIKQYSRGAKQSDDITLLALRITRQRPLHCSITLDADVAELEKLFAFMGRELENAACPEKIRGQIELASEEIFVNIARYAYHPGAGEVLIEYRTEQNAGKTTVTVVFSDQGEPFNPLELKDPDVTAPIEQRKVGGLGVLLIKRIMDSIQYEYIEGMNRLQIKKSW